MSIAARLLANGTFISSMFDEITQNTISIQPSTVFASGLDEVTGVVIGYKFKNDKMTDEVCIGFRVKEKKPLDQLTKEETLPKVTSRSDILSSVFI
jgi:hypothetical protein